MLTVTQQPNASQRHAVPHAKALNHFGQHRVRRASLRNGQRERLERVELHHDSLAQPCHGQVSVMFREPERGSVGAICGGAIAHGALRLFSHGNGAPALAQTARVTLAPATLVARLTRSLLPLPALARAMSFGADCRT